MSGRSLGASLFGLLRLVMRRKPGLQPGASIPRIERSMSGVRIDASWLRAYRNIIGDVDDGFLPPCTPQVRAIDLHLAILGDARFPFPALGIVHLTNAIKELQRIPADAPLDLACHLEGQQETERGTSFDIVTQAHVNGVLAWRSVLTALVRNKQSAARAKSPRIGDDAARPVLSSSVVRAPADLGRRYSRIAGDANPIHLSALAAKPFGFPRAIAHGMWTLARSVAEVSDALPPVPRRIDARFIRPVLLPSAFVIELSPRNASGAHTLRVDPLQADAPHMLGEVAPL